MKHISVPLPGNAAGSEILEDLARRLGTFAPELQKAATYILENPNLISISSIRSIAQGAQVKPNTLVRMARALGFDGYEAFRKPFREEVKQGRESFPDRARWLQSLARGSRLSGLYAEMAAASIANIESLFSGSDARSLQAAAGDIVKARVTYVLGVGVANAIAHNFAYLANMTVGTVSAIPRDGSLPVDGLLQAGRSDVLLAMTFKPYRREVVEAVSLAHAEGLTVIGISDSPASPILAQSKHRFVVPVDTPQFFTSTVALSAFLETLMAFVIAAAGPDVITNIERFHQRRHELGIYLKEGK
ncbi:MurR/RpiR family transcriptional regulator [Geminicoccaceae bacterium 1502E]|nr:MurR/RpiR family transcriptional regulator [Geminicoccaceae bacterium 1502E]